MIQVVYIAGPYRAETTWGVEMNIQAARLFGATVARLGAMPLIPHSNTSHFEGIQDDRFWLEGTMELLRRSDAVLMIDSWQFSGGAKAEHDEALALGKPVFTSIADLEQWLNNLNL